MRIQRLTLERYGIFADRELSFDTDAGLHVVYGANEAGKTSALSAIGDLLFGFGGRTPYDFRHDSKTLRVGGLFRHSSGRLLAVRRRKGNKKTLIDEADQPLSDDTLAAFLEGVSRDVFNREFGLSAQALREGGRELLEAGGRLAETLAASSAGMTALSHVRAKLSTEADGLFTPRRSASKPFYLAVDRRDDADRTLRNAIVTRESVQQLENQVQDAQTHLGSLTQEHKHSVAVLALLQRANRVRAKLARLQSLDTELGTYADLPPVSAHSLAEWREAHEKAATLDRELVALDAADAADQAEIAALAVDERLLSEGGTIDSLREKLEAVRNAIDALPRRQQARDAAKAELEENARRLGLSSYAELLDRLPTDPALAQARDLIARIKDAERKIADAEARRSRAAQEFSDAENIEPQSHVANDFEQLQQRFDAFDMIPAQVEQLRRATAALAIETDALTAAATALEPSPGALETIRSLPLPDESVISRHMDIAELNQNDERRLCDGLAALDNTIAATEAQLASLSGGASAPTQSDLIKARRERDIHLDTLRTAMNADAATRTAHLAAVRLASEAIDSITDLLLTDTTRTARHEAMQQRLSEAVAERGRAADALAGLQARMSEADRTWKEQWAASGIAPRSPAEMRRWRGRLQEILSRLDRRDAQKADIAAIEMNLEAAKVAVIAFLQAVGRRPNHELSPEVLFREARGRLDELQTAWADSKARAVTRQRIARDLNEAAAAHDIAEHALAALRQSWPDAMSIIGLPADATPAQAEAALLVWQAVALPKASYEREGRSVDSIRADIEAFDSGVLVVANQTVRQVKDETAQQTLARLSDALADMRSAKDACNRLQEARMKRAVSRRSVKAQRAALALTLDNARTGLNVSDIAALPDAIARASERQRLESERIAEQRDLAVTADGRDEATLRAEQSGVDFDSLPTDITQETFRQDQLMKDITAAATDHYHKQTELDALLKGRNAAALTVERAEANVELLSIAERWLLRSVAVRLAGRTIERHRATLQNPLISRAGELFATVTASSFSGLGIDYGDEDQPVLVARRDTGEQVSVSGLSEGTRDQLFLVLRLALLEHRSSEALPFIGDDLLASFDDERSLAMLRLLAIAGRQQQMILFTHHKHVVDLAKSLQSGLVDIINL